MWRRVVDSTRNDKITPKPRVPGWGSDHSHNHQLHMTATCEPRRQNRNNPLIYSYMICVIVCECVCGDVRVDMCDLCGAVYFYTKIM